MYIRSKSFHDMQPIPAEFAFGKPGPNGEPCVFSDNRNPHLIWGDVPEGTRSFVLTCIDSDVPTVGDDVNQPGRRVRADLPRGEFACASKQAYVLPTMENAIGRITVASFY